MLTLSASGQRTSNPQWAYVNDYLQWTVDVISFFANDLGSSVSMIQLLNEVAAYTSAVFLQATRQYWIDGYNAVRNATEGSGIQVMIGDGFQGVDYWRDFMEPPTYTQVTMDYVGLLVVVLGCSSHANYRAAPVPGI